MPKVPDTNTFSLQDVYDSVHGHAAITAGNLSSCFENAVNYYYDPLYNNTGFAPANSMLRFRNYTPYSVTNWLHVIVLNNPAESGKTARCPRRNHTSNLYGGDWYYSGNGYITLTSGYPSFFNVEQLNSANVSSPKRGDVVTMKVQQSTDSPTHKAFNPASGHKLLYFITQTQYTEAQLATILANAINLPLSTEVTQYETLHIASFDFTISLTQSNYIYMIWDFRQ
jgi:hypothetical protein